MRTIAPNGLKGSPMPHGVEDAIGPMSLLSPFHLDLTTESLWYGSQRLPLRPKAWALLRYLVENSQRLITQAELLDAIWQREYVSDGLLRGSIRELRRVLQDETTAPRF